MSAATASARYGHEAARLRVLKTLAPTALCRRLPTGVASASTKMRTMRPSFGANHSLSRERIVKIP